MKRRFDQFKQRRHSGNYVDRDEAISHYFSNIRFFVSNAALSADTDDDNAWFIDFGASIHMS